MPYIGFPYLLNSFVQFAINRYQFYQLFTLMANKISFFQGFLLILSLDIGEQPLV